MAFVPIRNPRRRSTGQKAGKFMGDVLRGVKSGLDERERKKQLAEEKAMRKAAEEKADRRYDEQMKMKRDEIAYGRTMDEKDYALRKAEHDRRVAEGKTRDAIDKTELFMRFGDLAGRAGGGAAGKAGGAKETPKTETERLRGLKYEQYVETPPMNSDFGYRLYAFNEQFSKVRDREDMSPHEKVLDAAYKVFGVKDIDEATANLSEDEQEELGFLIKSITSGAWRTYVNWAGIRPDPGLAAIFSNKYENSRGVDSFGNEIPPGNGPPHRKTADELVREAVDPDSTTGGLEALEAAVQALLED